MCMPVSVCDEDNAKGVDDCRRNFIWMHRRRNRGGGGGGLGPLTFLFEGAQYDRSPFTFEKCLPIFELKVTPYFQS